MEITTKDFRKNITSEKGRLNKINKRGNKTSKKIA